MKKTILLSFLLLAISCGKNQGVIFCEGVNREGEGVRCGTKFEAGDLTAIVRSENPFEASSIKVDVFQIDGQHEEKIDSLTIQTKPDDTQKAVPLSLYQGGTFKIKAKKGEDVFSEGEITIVEN